MQTQNEENNVASKINLSKSLEEMLGKDYLKAKADTAYTIKQVEELNLSNNLEGTKTAGLYDAISSFLNKTNKNGTQKEQCKKKCDEDCNTNTLPDRNMKKICELKCDHNASDKQREISAEAGKEMIKSIVTPPKVSRFK